MAGDEGLNGGCHGQLELIRCQCIRNSPRGSGGLLAASSNDEGTAVAVTVFYGFSGFSGFLGFLRGFCVFWGIWKQAG
jgi:hypothetical protein